MGVSPRDQAQRCRQVRHQRHPLPAFPAFHHRRQALRVSASNSNCVLGTGPGGYQGLCDFSYYFGWCPSPCTCTATGTRNTRCAPSPLDIGSTWLRRTRRSSRLWSPLRLCLLASRELLPWSAVHHHRPPLLVFASREPAPAATRVYVHMHAALTIVLLALAPALRTARRFRRLLSHIWRVSRRRDWMRVIRGCAALRMPGITVRLGLVCGRRDICLRIVDLRAFFFWGLCFVLGWCQLVVVVIVIDWLIARASWGFYTLAFSSNISFKP